MYGISYLKLIYGSVPRGVRKSRPGQVPSSSCAAIKGFKPGNSEIEYIVPTSKGGPDTFDNMRPIHWRAKSGEDNNHGERSVII